MAFIETRFPNNLAPGAVGGPMFSTDIVEMSSGGEQRLARWSAPRQRYRITLVNRPQAELDELIAFFRAVRGRADGFRFRDNTDYSASAGSTGIVSLISGSNYQLYKRYTWGATVSDRKIVKPVNPITVAGGGTYSVDYTTGIVTHTGGAAPTGWTGEFDVPVRLDTDMLEASVINAAGGKLLTTWDSIDLIELRL